jgi:hypothetical protein
MENPTTSRYCRLSSPALNRIELIVGKSANNIRAVHFYSIWLSGTRRLSQTGRCHERHPALFRFTLSPTIYSVISIPGELRSTSRRVVGVQLEIRL